MTLSWVRRQWYLVLAAVVVVAGGLVWALWPSSAPPPPRARQYLAFTACLLTDAHGVGGPDAAPVWSGMQDASLQTRAKVQYQAVMGPATKENALPYLNGLVQRHCDVVLAVGTAQVAAVAADAPTYPAVRFVVVGGDVPGANVTRIPATSPEAVRAAVRDTVVSAVRR